MKKPNIKQFFRNRYLSAIRAATYFVSGATLALLSTYNAGYDQFISGFIKSDYAKTVGDENVQTTIMLANLILILLSSIQAYYVFKILRNAIRHSDKKTNPNDPNPPTPTFFRPPPAILNLLIAPPILYFLSRYGTWLGKTVGDLPAKTHLSGSASSETITFFITVVMTSAILCALFTTALQMVETAMMQAYALPKILPKPLKKN